MQKGVKDELQQVLDDLAPLAEAQGLDTAQVARGYDLALGGHLCTLLSTFDAPQLMPRRSQCRVNRSLSSPRFSLGNLWQPSQFCVFYPLWASQLTSNLFTKAE